MNIGCVPRNNKNSTRRRVLATLGSSIVAGTGMALGAESTAAKPPDHANNGNGNGGRPMLHVCSGGPRILITRSDQGPTTTVTIVSLDGDYRYTFDVAPGETINRDSMTGVRATWYRVESYHPRGDSRSLLPTNARGRLRCSPFCTARL